MRYAILNPVIPINSKLDISCMLDISYSTLSESTASKSKLKFYHTKLFISHLFSNNGSILTLSMISHS